MIKKMLMISLIPVIAGVFAGLVSVFGGGGIAETSSEVWNITSPPSARADGDVSIAEALIASGHFRRSEDQGRSTAVANGNEEEGEAASIPQIIAKAELDGQLIVSAILASGEMQSVNVGDVLGDQWTVVQVTSQAVILEKDGEKYTKKFFGY